MTTLVELKEQADHVGLSPEMVRLYGDLRLKATWEKALIANKTITVDAVEIDSETIIDEPEKIELVYSAVPADRQISSDEVASLTGLPSDEIPAYLLQLELAGRVSEVHHRSYIRLEIADEIIPFTHDQEAEVSDDEIAEVVETIYSDMREVFAKNAEAIADCKKKNKKKNWDIENPIFKIGDRVKTTANITHLGYATLGGVGTIIKVTTMYWVRWEKSDILTTCMESEIELAVDCPPPPPIIRPCPAPEIPVTIPGIEIAERESPRPGEGRGDERFKNLGDRLGEKIKADVFNYLDSIHKWMFNQFADFDRLTQYDYFDAWYQIDKFQSIHKTETIKIYEFINQAITLVTEIKQNHIPWYLQQDMPAPPVWCVTAKDDYFLLLERPGPIPTLSIDYGGEFIPNRYHELGINIYCWKFPTQLRAEEFFELIERATNYIFLPASQPQLLLAGV